MKNKIHIYIYSNKYGNTLHTATYCDKQSLDQYMYIESNRYFNFVQFKHTEN